MTSADTIEETGSPEQWQALPFESSVDLLLTVDPVLRNQKMGPDGTPFRLYPWQVEVPEFICKTKANSLEPLKYCLCAANGSGKDAFVIAPLALWFICCKVRSLVIITSSSGVQLSQQTESYIRSLAEKINTWCLETLGRTILKVNQRHIICTESGSHIKLFATDEEGKAEGYHPLEVGAEMMIIVNEAKSVAPEIFRALRRCTGYNYWLNVSTPGKPTGDFYKSWQTWEHKRRVTFFDCLRHQSRGEFETDKDELGEHSALFRSKWLAEFTFEDSSTVIPQEVMDRHIKRQRENAVKYVEHDGMVRLGLDIALSTDGDESVLTEVRGNKCIRQFYYRIKDATKLVDAVERDIEERIGIKKLDKNYTMRADAGGAGSPVIDIFRQRGWRVIRTLNNSAASDKEKYKNKGAELWYRMLRLIEEHVVIIPEEDKLIEQMLSRRFKQATTGIDKKQLEHKKEAIAAGMHSPDRADSLVLAFADLRVTDMKRQQQQAQQVVRTLRGRSAGEIEEDLLWGNGFIKRPKRRMVVHNSLQVLMNRL